MKIKKITDNNLCNFCTNKSFYELSGTGVKIRICIDCAKELQEPSEVELLKIIFKAKSLLFNMLTRMTDNEEKITWSIFKSISKIIQYKEKNIND